MSTSRSASLKLPVKFPNRPKCPYCGSFKTHPKDLKGNIAFYHCSECGNDFGIRKEEGWKRGVKYKRIKLPLKIKAGDRTIVLTKKFIDSRIKYGENVSLSFGIPMYGMAWTDSDSLYANLVTSTMKKSGDGYLISVLVNGYPIYTERTKELKGKVVL